MTNPDIITEARRRLERLLPTEQVTAWLQQVEALGAVLTLPIGEGVPFATYPRATPPCPRCVAAMDQNE